MGKRRLGVQVFGSANGAGRKEMNASRGFESDGGPPQAPKPRAVSWSAPDLWRFEPGTVF
jgi:hypothetical protein